MAFFLDVFPSFFHASCFALATNRSEEGAGSLQGPTVICYKESGKKEKKRKKKRDYFEQRIQSEALVVRELGFRPISHILQSGFEICI
jgi:hypothetical protein